MTAHYLAVNHESYDGDSVFGVFDSWEAARDYLETPEAEAVSSTAVYAVVEEWQGAALTAMFDRMGGAWVKHWYRHDPAGEGIQ